MAEKPLTPVEQRRQAALAAMDRYAEKHGVSRRGWIETASDDTVTFLGIADDGQRFRVNYKKATRQEILAHG